MEEEPGGQQPEEEFEDRQDPKRDGDQVGDPGAQPGSDPNEQPCDRPDEGHQSLGQRVSAWAGKNKLLIEVIVVLLLAAVPDIYNAIVILGYSQSEGGGPESSFNQMAIGIMARSLQVSAPILYIVWRTGDGFASVGLVPFRWLRDLSTGVGAFAAQYAIYFILAWVLYYAMMFLDGDEMLDVATDDGGAPAMSLAGFAMIVLMSVFNAFAEELAMRGYLLTRLEKLTQSTTWALLASTMVFASYHAYQGAYGILNAALFGLIAGALYISTRSLWPVFIVHLLGDVVPSVGWMLSDRV